MNVVFFRKPYVKAQFATPTTPPGGGQPTKRVFRALLVWLQGGPDATAGRESGRSADPWAAVAVTNSHLRLGPERVWL